MHARLMLRAAAAFAFAALAGTTAMAADFTSS